jgi:hypothetical protein
MTARDPAGDRREPEADTDAMMAARLRDVHRMLAEIDIDPDARIRLHLRFMAICASLKIPGASVDRCARRLDRLVGDAKSGNRRRVGRDQ